MNAGPHVAGIAALVGEPAGAAMLPCRTCTDWRARRHHLAGALGAALLHWLVAGGGARRLKGSRAAAIKPTGPTALRPLLARAPA